MKAFVVPSIFTAVDKYRSVLNGMGAATQNFNNKLETINARSERLFKKLTPGLSDAGKQMLSFASSAAVVAGVFATARFSADSIMGYEDALQSFRTIVSDLSDDKFKKFEGAIGSVAKGTKRSTIEVAQAFEKIAGLNSEFAKTTEGISAVTTAAITLSKASRDELGVSAENLVGILNQFSLGANEANRTINVLAAGQAVGAASITNTAESFKVFGAVAKQSNLSLEQSVALTEVLASKQIMGAEAGTALRGTLVRLKASGLGYKSGLFDTRDALEEVNAKYAKLKTAKEKDALLDKVFGTINLTTGSILMNNIDLYDKYTKGVTGTSEAQKAAEINSNTLRTRLSELSNSWVNLLTDSTNVNTGLQMLKDGLKYTAENLGKILTIGLNVIKFFALWKLSIIAVRAYMVASNIVIGIHNALTLRSTAAIAGNTVATTAATVAEKAMAASIALSTGNIAAFNAALSIGPLGAFAIAIGAVVLAIAGFRKAVEIFQEPLNAGFQRTDALKKEGVAVLDLRDNYLALGKTLEDAERLAVGKAAVNLKTDIIAAKMQLASPIEEERQKGVEAINLIQGRAQQLNNFNKKPSESFNGDFGQRFANTKELGTFVGSAGTADTKMNASPDWLNMKPAVNPKLAQQQALINTVNTNNNNTSATLTIVNDSNSSANIESGSKSASVMPSMKSTLLMSSH